ATGEQPEGEIQAVSGEPETGGNAARFGFGGVTTRGVVRLFGATEASHVRRGRGFLEREPELFEPSSRIVQVTGGERVFERGRLPSRGSGPRVLRQVAEGAVVEDHAGGGRRLTRQDLQHAGLAGTVAADEPHLVPGAHGERRLADDEPSTDLDRE